MRAVDVIRTKRDGGPLSDEQIGAFVRGACDGSWAEYQLSALLMAVVLRGMSFDETRALTLAMARSGTVLDLGDVPGPKVDKHSTGGVGDKTSLVIAPLAAACGLVVPMMSGRGLGHTGGTLDKLEAIPGFRTELSLDEFRAALRAVGCALIGQTAEVAPADRVLYALRDVTATVESIPLIVASILSKKIAEGAAALVMDVKCGRGAFLPARADAVQLARWLCEVGTGAGLRTEAVVTGMDTPLGRSAGNALEVREAVEVLRGGGPADLRELCLVLTARLLALGGVADPARRAAEALASGAGLEKFRQVVARQGGDERAVDDLDRLPRAPRRHVVRAERAGVVTALDALAVGRACVALGAGRDRAGQPVDPGVGVVFLARPGDAVKAGDGLLEIHHADGGRLADALALLDGACAVGDSLPGDGTPGALVLEVVTADPGVE